VGGRGGTVSSIASDPPAPLAVVQELTRRFNCGDRAGAMELYHPEIRIQQPSSLPHGGWHQGKDGMVEMAAQFGRHWDRTIGEPRVLASNQALVVQLSTQTWTAKETGRSATVDVLELMSFRDGLISEIRVFQQDTHLLLSTLEG
jgi:hypothetical protein